MSSFVPFFGGAPVEPDVKKLIETFGKPAAGTQIEHAQIEAVIDEKRSTARYRTVTSAWRQRLFSDADNLMLASVKGVGFRSLKPDERVRDAGTQFKSAARRISTGVVRAAATPPQDLSEIDRQRRNHMILQGTHLERQMKSMRDATPRLPAPSNTPDGLRGASQPELTGVNQ